MRKLLVGAAADYLNISGIFLFGILAAALTRSVVSSWHRLGGVEVLFHGPILSNRFSCCFYLNWSGTDLFVIFIVRFRLVPEIGAKRKLSYRCPETSALL